MATATASRPTTQPRKPAFRIYIVRQRAIRELHVRPWLAVAVAVLGGLFFVTYFAATGYLVFRDDLLAASFARQARQRVAYEDRIAALRADIDRLSGRQLLNQEEFEERLEDVATRQAMLDERQKSLADLGKAAKSAGLVVPDNDTSEDGETADDELTTGSIDAPADREPGLMLDVVETSLDDLAENQVSFLEEIASDAAERSERIVAVLEEVGRDVPKETGNEDAMGGPFIPMPERCRSRDLPRRCRTGDRPGRALRDAQGYGKRTAADDADEPGKHHQPVRHANRPLPAPAGDAHRHRFPRPVGRAGARPRPRERSSALATIAATDTWSRSTMATA